MGLISKEVEIGLSPNNIKYYQDLGYSIPRNKNIIGKLVVKKGTIIKIKIEDLPKGSNVYINVQCNNCSKIKSIMYIKYNKYVKEDGKYYCCSCARKLYAAETRKLTKLKNGKSFEQWCINNDRQDILDRWDYELNNCLPSDITYGTNIKHYFKCPRKLHGSELKHIGVFTHGQDGSMDCNACNSFAQWGIDSIGEDFLDKYWDYEKNTFDPWEISYGSGKSIYIICQEKDYHGSYNITPQGFAISNVRCSYCGNFKVHPLDSLGKLLKDKELLHLWSDKNKISPYEYAPKSSKDVYWKCPKGIHEDYCRKINDSNTCNFRCPECEYSKGEEKISNYFINLGFIKITDEDYKILDDTFKLKNNYYISQKKFDGLVGLGKGLLSYDFYLPNKQHNILIEYQGMQHEKYCKGFHKSNKDFEKQVEHDRRKCEYANSNSIELLEIWYWDFDNIEEILIRELNENFNKEDKEAI